MCPEVCTLDGARVVTVGAEELDDLVIMDQLPFRTCSLMPRL